MSKIHLAAALIVIFTTTAPAGAWFNETHLAIAKVAGYKKWYNAAAADIARVKLGKLEGYNHYHNSPPDTVITTELVLEQARLYDKVNPDGHLYGAILGALRVYIAAKARGNYAENHMAYLVHYVGDLSMPLHHMMSNEFNRKFHLVIDGIIEDEVLGNQDKIQLYPITITSEADLAIEVARVANISKNLGYQLEAQDRLLTREEAYQQIGHSASLLRAILAYAGNLR